MTTSTATLTSFLLARIAEDERHARKLAETDRRPVLSLATTVNHPERLLAECEAKRRIVELREGLREPSGLLDRVTFPTAGASLDAVLRLLALPYADHAEYRSEWAP